MVDVSIVIVCMNNLKNLCPCLDGIKKNTSKVTYEIFVVAYLFSKENLDKVRKEYTWVNLIISDEIRGFSENNNLALKQAKGKYCLVLNDDTEMTMPVIDKLFERIENLPNNIAIISPVPMLPDGQIQYCGRPCCTWYTYILSELRLYNEKKDDRFCNKKGVFKSYNIIGAVFLIKTEIFKEMGWFDEYYFFSPEDLALSTKLNQMGYECWVDSDVNLIHYEGMTGKNRRGLSYVQAATMPASAKGIAYFLSGEKLGGLGYFLICMFIFSESLFFATYYKIRSMFYDRPNLYDIWALGKIRICYTIFSMKTPKEIFVQYFKK